jgi:hypothetical protein
MERLSWHKLFQDVFKEAWYVDEETAGHGYAVIWRVCAYCTRICAGNMLCK